MKLREIYNQLYESNKLIAYHGSKIDFDSFDLNRVGNGNDQNGPGFYFTINSDEAKRYGDFVHKYELNIKKWLSTKQPVNIQHIQQLVKNSPNFNETIYDWGETPQKGLKTFLEDMRTQDSNFHAFTSVWYDFYRHDAIDYVKNVIKLGYDAVMIKDGEGYGNINSTHIIVYNPKVIKKIERI